MPDHPSLKTISRISRALVCTLGLLVSASLATAVTSEAPPFVPDQILIKPARGATEVDLHALLSFHGASEVDRIPELDVRVVQVPKEAAERVLTALSQNPKIKFAEKDFVA